MNRTELINAVCEIENDGATNATTKQIVENTLQVIIESLVNKEDVALKGFGTFKIVEQAPRTARNPATGGTVNVPAKTKLKFKVSKILLDEINE